MGVNDWIYNVIASIDGIDTVQIVADGWTRYRELTVTINEALDLAAGQRFESATDLAVEANDNRVKLIIHTSTSIETIETFLDR